MLRRTLTHALALFAVFLLVASTTGCERNVDPTDPEGAYNLFIDAIWADDAEGAYGRLSPSSHEYFQEQYERLEEMDETIKRYLPATDHQIAREQAGSILTSEVKDGKGLFLKLFKPKQLTLEQAQWEGAKVEEIRINTDETAAELKTRGGDVFYLTAGEGENAKGETEKHWFVMLIRSSGDVKTRMKWLESNQSALQQTVEDLIAEEREKREKIIAELMKLESEKAEEDAPEGESETEEQDGGSDDGQQEDSGDNGQP